MQLFNEEWQHSMPNLSYCCQAVLQPDGRRFVAYSDMDHALQGNWGLTLLELGQHKGSYLALLQASSPNGDAAAVEASAARLRQEARQALVRAGQLFREVVLVRAWPSRDSAVLSRVSWSWKTMAV